ncbi:hypothetical protein NIES2104_51380 [Leptolyngbya sp. NIES-2104]|nr:hypothetical protein NIES2104_51380 [Leptolyngbya sp. NIES-2104]
MPTRVTVAVRQAPTLRGELKKDLMSTDMVMPHADPVQG